MRIPHSTSGEGGRIGTDYYYGPAAAAAAAAARRTVTQYKSGSEKKKTGRGGEKEKEGEEEEEKVFEGQREKSRREPPPPLPHFPVVLFPFSDAGTISSVPIRGGRRNRERGQKEFLTSIPQLLLPLPLLPHCASRRPL